ncbi:hypothetical protein OHV05_01830 [Kitasatospora sp. NBC_00070]|uniref:hypothetical protein n=1 Tax=Kitasatospora sp. NBC_00070 TaxID=2975962 RepID=UPI0032492555
MSHATAYPILRTTDLTEALTEARRVLRIADLSETEVFAHAKLATVEELLPLRAAFPGAWYSAKCGRVGADGAPFHGLPDEDLPGDADSLARLLPLEFSQEEQPLGALPDGYEEAFLSAVGAGPASLEWWWTRWPAVPELDLPPGAKHADVQIAVHSADLFREVPADAHTLYVHVGPHEAIRADWIAAQVGLHVVGPGLWVG